MLLDWISVKKELPQDGEIVMAVYYRGLIQLNYMYWDGVWNSVDKSFEDEESNFFSSKIVTHWIPYPEAPEEFEESNYDCELDFIKGVSE